MDVTSDNFQARLPDIEAAIDSAAFIAIDGEFTGLSVEKGSSPFDLPAERYDRVRDAAGQFLLVQLGLATFHYDAKEDRFTHRAFNVYCWPRPCRRNAPDRRFLCQTSSIDFLSNQKFDFNKLFREGVSYLQPAELERLQEGLRTTQAGRRLSQADQAASLPIRVPEEQEAFLARVMDSVEAFLASEDAELEVENCNSFQRRLVYQTARQRFPDSVQLSSSARPGTSERGITVVRADREQQAKIALQQDQGELAELEAALGVTRIVRKITESGKLVVGHNMLLDVAFTLSQFCGPLPQDYSEFKLMASTALPNIIDTKLMASSSPFKHEIANSSLEQLHRTVALPPYQLASVPPASPEEGYSEAAAGRYHEAAYDALATGCCFIALSQRLHSLSGGGGRGGRVLPGSPLLQPFLNKLFLMRVQDIPYIDLAGQDLLPARDHVFHVRFPREWKTSDLVKLFEEFGGVFVSWVDETSAFVALREKEMAGQVLSVLQSSSVYSVQSWAAHHAEGRELHCGATPTLEKAKPFSTNGGQDAKKRGISAGAKTEAPVKRHKSETEEGGEDRKAGAPKTFAEPEWD